MLTKLMTTLVLGGLVCFAVDALAQTGGGAGLEQTPEYQAYEWGGKIGAELFAEFLIEKDALGNRILRTAAILRFCGNDGLANAVDAKNADRSFKDRIGKFVQMGKFKDVPEAAQVEAALEAQNMANSLYLGWALGSKDILGITEQANPSTKRALCDAGMKAANDLLK